MLDRNELLTKIIAKVDVIAGLEALSGRTFFDHIPEGFPSNFCRITEVFTGNNGGIFGGKHVDNVIYQFSVFSDLQTALDAVKAIGTSLESFRLPLTNQQFVSCHRTTDQAPCRFSSRLPNGDSIFHAMIDLEFKVAS